MKRVSAGSLYGSGNEKAEAVAGFERAKALTKLPKLLKEIEGLLAEARA